MRQLLVSGVLVIFSLAMLPSCMVEKAHAEDANENFAEIKQPSKKTSTESETTSVKPLNVKVETVAPTTISQKVLARGATSPVRDVIYSSEIAGKISHLSAEIGDTVKRGQVLARINTGTLKAQVEQAQASYDLAKSTQERLQGLLNDELVSRQQMDEANTRVVGAKAQLSMARVNLAKGVVKASHKGIVTEKYMEKSEFAGPGARIYHVVDYKTIIVEAQLAESNAGLVKAGTTANVRIDAIGETLQGTVETVVPTADPVSKTFTARVKVDNSDMKILVGMSASVEIGAQVHENVIAVRHGVIVDENENKFIFAVKNGKAVKRQIETGISDGNLVVVTKGLEKGERIVVVGQRSLIDGQPVEIVK